MENINRSKSTYTVACLPVYGVSSFVYFKSINRCYRKQARLIYRQLESQIVFHSES